MSKIGSIIQEEISTYLQEIFDASHTPYRWERGRDGNDYYYSFFTTNNDEYFVDIDIDEYEGIKSWVISFETEEGGYKKVINKGDVFRTMSTIVDIIKDFINIENPDIMTFIPAKNDPEDERRLKMYMGYISKHLPSQYKAEIDYDLDPPEVVIKKTTINEPEPVINESDAHKDYLRWKRKNVTLRGMRDRYSENDAGARFGSGLYTAFLGNRAMAKEYGKVYFVLNAIPKHPKVVQDTNQAEIFLQGIINDYSKEHGRSGYDPTYFYENTNIADEMMNRGYDGLVIKGREMVNYDPPEDDIRYFENENQLYRYYEDFIAQ